MNKEKILIVEDNKNIHKLLKYNLEKAGFGCTIAISGEKALEILDTQDIDLVILDIMLPKMDGYEVCKQIKRDGNLKHIPIIMLTAKGEELDRVLGLELGADDYVVKPFSLREMILRIKAILKRGKPKETAKNVFSVGKLKIDIPRHKVIVDNKKVTLSAMEFKLLVALMKERGRVLSRDVLLDIVWGISAEVTTRTVDTHIKLLRKKLGKAGKMIETVRGVGYKVSEWERD